ncbi:MAG: response regulator transcription factor [Acidobacteria bacterium]|nr:response regulator transcription factor [Acidobacteriota bacterium]
MLSPGALGNMVSHTTCPRTQASKPTILLADDDPALLQGLQKLLESEFSVVACVRDGCDLLEAAKAHAPDVIITDISMPCLSGIRAARHLKLAQPQIRIIFLTVHDEPAFLAEAKKIGALGYVVKQSAALDLIPAIQEALQGRSFVSPALRN